MYWSFDTGPIIEVHFKKDAVKPSVSKQSDGWNCIISEHHQQVIIFVNNTFC